MSIAIDKDDFFNSINKALINNEASKEKELAHMRYLLSCLVYIMGGEFNISVKELYDIVGSNLKVETVTHPLTNETLQVELSLFKDSERSEILGVKRH
jgi:hypothetical protein